MDDPTPSLDNPTDAQLMQRMANDDVRAFDVLLTRHQTAVFHFIRRLTGNASQAEDLTQECFLRVWRARGSYLPTAMFRTWIFTIARRLALDAAKSRRVEILFLEEEPFPAASNSAGESDPHHMAERRELACILDAALDRLSPDLLEVILLRDVEQMSYDQIASIVGCPLGTVKSRLNAARTQLRSAARNWFEAER